MGGGQQRDVKKEVTWSKQWAIRSGLYGNVLKGYEQGKVAFLKAEEKDVSLITLQSDSSFSQNRHGYIF